MSNQIDNSVAKFRQQRQLTQEDLARAVGVSRQTIIAIEKGNYVPSLLLGLKIARFFKHPVDTIFNITP